MEVPFVTYRLIYKIQSLFSGSLSLSRWVQLDA